MLAWSLELGNGTQSILMGLNEVTHTHEMSHKSESVHTGESERRSTRRRGWKGFYGSLHDIVSIAGRGYEGMQAMSMSIVGADEY